MNNNKKIQKKLNQLPNKKSAQVKKDYKTIWIHKSIHAEINNEGKKGDTYDDIMNRIFKVYRKYKDVYVKENGSL